MKITRRKRSIMRRMGHVAAFRITYVTSGTMKVSEDSFLKVGDRITIAGVRRFR